MSTRQFKPGELPGGERRSRRDRHLLALSGGGYRGLFTASVLAAAEKVSGQGLASRFDMMAGTSIGGILAIGLACDVSAVDLVAMMREHGPTIFTPRPLSFAGLSKSHYGSTGLRRAVRNILGPQNAARRFAEIPRPLVVVTVHEESSQPHVFRTRLAGGDPGQAASTLDVALATSAAPTFFPPHVIGGEVHVDGGLVANAPDLVVLTEAMRRFACELSECRLLSVGTAGVPRRGRVGGAPGKFGWVLRHEIFDLMTSAQEALAIEQVRTLRPGAFMRVDATPNRKIMLDETGDDASELLTTLAMRAVADIVRTQPTEWRRFLAHAPA